MPLDLTWFLASIYSPLHSTDMSSTQDLTMRETAKCIDLSVLQKLSASVHLISDIVIFLLPQKVIFDLNMSIQKRLGLAVVFSLGLL